MREEISKLLMSLDISDDMFRTAVERYTSIGNLLDEKLGGATVYPQGSFSIGTTTLPYKKGKDCSYDIDLIVEVYQKKEDINGEVLLQQVYDILNEDKNYKGNISKYEKSVTIEYAEKNGVGFNLDIVPAVEEEQEIKDELINLGGEKKYVDSAIAISSLDKEDKRGWYTAIPKGYKDWFEEINKPYKNSLFERLRNQNGKVIYCSIEDVPRYKIKTSVQKVIQILKRIRDIYFYKRDKESKKPISAIITTIVAEIAEEAKDYNITTVDLLMKVLSSLKVYSEYETKSLFDFQQSYPDYKKIRKENGEWKMINPVNPKDNLVDAWNDKEDKNETSKLFFEWVRFLEKQFAELIKEPNECNYENLFGTKIVDKTFGISEKENIVEGPKPYGESR